MGRLGIARVPYANYLRFMWPLQLVLAALTIVMLAIGSALT